MTIVAAWINADTGVGPAMASPSQDCSGNCADLPHAPSSSNKPTASNVPCPIDEASPWTVAKSKAPRLANSTAIAVIRPTSPMRLTTNALLAALAKAGFQFQKPISR